jgi:hypothetical protein
MAGDNISRGGAESTPQAPTHTRDRAAFPPPAKCPCEERTEGKLCRKESDSMTALGKLLCKEHREAYEAKWSLKLNRLQMMV